MDLAAAHPLKLITGSFVNARVLQARLISSPPDHPDTANSQRHLALCYTAIGQHQQAFELRQELLALARRKSERDAARKGQQ